MIKKHKDTTILRKKLSVMINLMIKNTFFPDFSCTHGSYGAYMEATLLTMKALTFI